jgi:tetraacyldisaccharide 4'-kinase
MRAPDFWTTDEGLSRLLAPIGYVYGAVTTARVARDNQPRAPVPVISVGGLTVGGAGKTPVAMALVLRLQSMNRKPAVILRGYGGTLKGPVRVEEHIHTSSDVGDEALLHAATCPTWVARRRIDGARAAAAQGADVAVLDDGHQHPGLHKDLRIVVLDGEQPFGNGYVFPAGPLREKPADGLARADAVVIMGQDIHHIGQRLPPSVTLLHAELVPDARALALRARPVVAFAGIGRPEKFFDTLRILGARIVAMHPFEDHAAFGDADIQPILDEAFAINAVPVTTAKDAVRLSPDQRQQVDVVNVEIRWSDPNVVDALLGRALKA